MKKHLIFVGACFASAWLIWVINPVKVHAQPFPGNIQPGTAGQTAVYTAARAIGPGNGVNPSSIITSNETAIALTSWANSPSGALDMSFSGYTYSITAASAITSFSNTRLAPYMNFVSFNVTNPGASDLTLFITASGYLENDGGRSYVITNKSQREIRFSSSQFGVRGVSQPWF